MHNPEIHRNHQLWYQKLANDSHPNETYGDPMDEHG